MRDEHAARRRRGAVGASLEIWPEDGRNSLAAAPALRMNEFTVNRVGFRTPRDAEQLLPLHDEVNDPHGESGQRQRQPAEPVALAGARNLRSLSGLRTTKIARMQPSAMSNERK